MRKVINKKRRGGKTEIVWMIQDKVDGLSLVVNMVWFGDLFMVLIYSAPVQNITLWLLLYQ